MTTLTGSTFETNEPLLSELIAEISQGNIQLPDFQRGWVWDDPHIRALIASVSLAQPIGAVMLLEMGGDEVRFKTRLLEGVELKPDRKPNKLILDGQQRLTSLYLSLISHQPVFTQTEKKEKIERWYYFNMAKCLDPNVDREDAIFGVPEDKILRSDFGRVIDLDLSTLENEYAAACFPVHLLFDTTEYYAWQSGFQAHYQYQREKMEFLNQFQQEVWLPFQKYKVPVIELLRGTSKEAVCQVFEKVNTGGVTLSVFELMTATYAADDFLLREDWTRRQRHLHDDALPMLHDTDEVAFLTSVTLLTSYRKHLSATSIPLPAVSCKRKDVLRLALDEYRTYADRIEEGFVKAARLLMREKVFDLRSLPYGTQLIPLAAICSYLEHRFDEDNVKKKLAQWYWCGVFGELYGGANETRFALDLPEIIRWLESGEEPRTIKDASFAPTRLLSLRTRNSAAYKGLMALLMKEGSRDFINGDPIELTNYFDEAVDIHHIFPEHYSQRMGYKEEKWNSVVNKAVLTARTNRMIGGRAPSEYLETVNKHISTAEQVDLILKTHCIDAELLRQDDFDNFFRQRAIALLDLIEKATGKQVVGRDSTETISAFGGSLLP